MFNRYLTYYRASSQFIILCAILSMCWLVGAMVTNFIHVKLTGYTSEQLSAMTVIPNHLAELLKWISPMLLVFLLLLPALLFSYLAYPKPIQYLGLKEPIRAKFMLMGVLWLLVSLPFTNWLEHWNSGLRMVEQFKASDAEYDKLASAMLNGHTVSDLFINILTICILPAIIEEIFFRGCLQQIFLNWMRKTPYAAIILVALIFSAFHMQWSAFVPRFFLGIILGLIYFYSGSLWASIAMHFMNNFLTVFLLFAYQNNYISIDFTHLPDLPMWLTLISVLACIGVGFGYYRSKRSALIYEVDQSDKDNDEFQFWGQKN